jgi:hypothetical protein
VTQAGAGARLAYGADDIGHLRLDAHLGATEPERLGRDGAAPGQAHNAPGEEDAGALAADEPSELRVLYPSRRRSKTLNTGAICMTAADAHQAAAADGRGRVIHVTHGDTVFSRTT